MQFDLLIRGGELIDPGSGRQGPYDVAVRGGVVVAVEKAIPATAAAEVIDAAGKYVVPGLVDLHTHLYSGSTFWGIDHEPIGWHTGVTTWVDAGSAGAYTFRGLQEHILEPSSLRAVAMLNIASTGLTGRVHELWHRDDWDVELATRVVTNHPGQIVGLKVRMDRPVVGRNGLSPLGAAIEVGRRCGLPVMVHIGNGPPGVDSVLALLGPGDIVTHCCTGAGMRLVDTAGRVRSSARRARERGVLFDLGHGAGGFSFGSAEAMLADGFLPDVISSDTHCLSVAGPMVDLPNCLSKLMALGLGLDQVIAAATTAPAQAVGIATICGSLRLGAPADVVLLSLERGSFVFNDVVGQARTGSARLAVTDTIVAGRRRDGSHSQERVSSEA